MTKGRDMTSKKRQARIAGLLYLMLLPTGIFSLIYVPSTLAVFGDAAATIQNIEASELLYRSGIYVGLLSSLIYLLVALALYRLLKDVSEKQAILMVAFVVLSVAASFANSFNQLAVLIILSKPEFLSAFDPAQLEGAAYLFIRLYSHGNQIIQVFWGLWLIPMGILVYRSGFIPRIIGISLWIAAAAYLLSNFTFLLLPQYTAALYPVFTALEMLELPIILWLVIVGVRASPVETS
ncbi:MAG: DUF4386 domain-containing protein [Chromatiales bacterium]|nr:MAG: DUF4386 domain-containing protein [Chromatiales bacterium]